MPDFDSLEYDVLYDGKYLEIDFKQAASGDIIVFTRDTAMFMEVFWLFEHKDEGKHIFLDDKSKFWWTDKKQKK